MQWHSYEVKNLENNIRNPDYYARAHERLKSILVEINEIENPVFDFRFVTNAKIPLEEIRLITNQETRNNSKLSIIFVKRNYNFLQGFYLTKFCLVSI